VGNLIAGSRNGERSDTLLATLVVLLIPIYLDFILVFPIPDLLQVAASTSREGTFRRFEGWARDDKQEPSVSISWTMSLTGSAATTPRQSHSSRIPIFFFVRPVQFARVRLVVATPGAVTLLVPDTALLPDQSHTLL